jgi:L-erythro-3,5-diaminohexanoate dehydrogenase
MSTRLGVHRSIDPPGALPQAARRLDPSLPIRSDEILIAVERLNVDSASFLEFEKLAVAAGVPVEEMILDTVRERGKLQNPVTGSGGMLIGSVREIGAEFPPRPGLEVGARIATLVSLTLTPLHLEAIESVNREIHQLAARGHAILFASGLWAPLPDDLPEAVALAVFDVAGAPAAVDRLVDGDDEVLVLGCGKAGMLSLARARAIARNRSAASKVFAIDADADAVRAVLDLDLADRAAVVDAADATAVLDTVAGWTDGRLCTKVFNFASGPGTEAASILATRESGTVFFYGMATSFSRAALTAEGVGKDIEMRIGSGYLPGWIDIALDTVRENPALRRFLEARYE